MDATTRKFEQEALTEAIIGAAMAAHSGLGGPGLLETAYQDALCYELDNVSLDFERELYVSHTYKTLRMNRVFRPDIIVAKSVILELKTVEKLLPLHDAQLRTYLTVTGLKTGLIFNFNTQYLKDGIRRIDLP